jgi:hypothetical protein
MPILLEDLNLGKAERLLCTQALNRAGSIVEAAQLLGITRHALKRRMIKHVIDWPQAGPHVGQVRDYRTSTTMEAQTPMSAAVAD